MKQNKNYLERKNYLDKIDNALAIVPICAMLGPRQCGKSTLARMYAESYKHLVIHVFDLEDPFDLSKLDNPRLALFELDGLIIIDEIQKRPDLFPILRVLVDKKPQLKILILGSASQELIKQSSETLAGRIVYIEVAPFSYSEVHDLQHLWLTGGFPIAYTAATPQQSLLWRKSYVNTFLERDIPNLGINIPANIMHRFWMMLCHYHGNIFNAADLARSLGYSDSTMKRYVDILVGTFMVRRLAPWFENIAKRQVKSPKLYIRDSGILHYFLGINDFKALLNHPKLGASWEGMALEEVIRHLDVEEKDCYFWATHNDAELDLLVLRDGNKYGFEFKYSDHPKLTPSMKIAYNDLQLKQVITIVPGADEFPLRENIRVIGLEKFLSKNPDYFLNHHEK